MAQFNLGLGGDLERQFPLPNGNPDTVIEQTMAPALGARTAALGDPAAAAVSAPEPPAGPALPAPAAPRPPDPVARPGGAVDPPSLGGGGGGHSLLSQFPCVGGFASFSGPNVSASPAFAWFLVMANDSKYGLLLGRVRCRI